MFTAGERDRIRERLLGLAGADPAVTGAALTGSAALGSSDEWSDIVYRVFLLPGWLEVDIGFTPAAQFGPRGPQWRTLFGQPVQTPHRAGPDPCSRRN